MTIPVILHAVLLTRLVSCSPEFAAPEEPEPVNCRLRALPDGPLTRGVHTTLLANFDATDNNDAVYARVHRADVGLGSEADVPGRFAGGVAIGGQTGHIRFPGLDNYHPLQGTAEFWIRSLDTERSIWSDGREHWLLVLYPERGAVSPRYGMAPYFIALRKTPENTLQLKIVRQAVAHYAAAVTLRQNPGWSLSLDTHAFDAAAWHHVQISWDLRGKGQIWLLANGEGVTAPIGLPSDAPRPNPGMFIVLGGVWGLPGDDVHGSQCAFDELHIQDVTVARWLADATARPERGIDQYDERNNFVWMRNFEPPAVSMQAVGAATWGLCLAYDLTADDRYLEPLRKALRWLDTVPERDRGWLWYDPRTGEPVVAYDNEMLPVTHPKAIEKIIPRLAAHYGVKATWPAERIRRELEVRAHGPVYPDWRGLRAQSSFADPPTADEFVQRYKSDPVRGARDQLAAWAAAKPLAGLLGGSAPYGRTFEIGNAIRYCESLLSDIEHALVGLGDMSPEHIPRYRRGGEDNWTYMEPQRNYFKEPQTNGNSP